MYESGTPIPHHRQSCERHEKVLFHSKNEARASLVGGLRSKRVRVYFCDEHKGQVHLTKEAVKGHKAQKRRDVNRD